MYSIVTVLLAVSLYVMEVLAVSESCIVSNSEDPIENCCDLGFRLSVFGQIINKPKIYKFNGFCNNCRSLLVTGYCDTLTNGGGWLVVQRRQDGSVDFNRGWVDYEEGFGSLTGEFWYGLQSLHCLTNQGQWEMRIDFTLTDGTKSYLSYSSFRVGPASSNYQLSISAYKGFPSSDRFGDHTLNGRAFTTKDKDNDNWSRNCAVNIAGNNAGGWWYHACSHMFINNRYKSYNGINFNGTWKSLSFTEMKIRPINCKL